ncbi:MAG: hypothetical protein IT438_12130 [Phycisphaerales bacterium]|nr:hypothetical protein [Phycisphaerales bacterium]
MEIPLAVYELARLAVLTRFRFGGAYWAWRMQTAFGRGKPASRWAMMSSILDYGRWMHRTRRMR